MTRNMLMVSLAGIAVFAASLELKAESFLVKDGKPMADIVIAKDPPRAVPLAAEELSDYVKKMSGAELPIVREPGKDVSAHVYVGESPYTEKLGVTAAGLKDGACVLKSGDGWLVLLGYDADFTPREPWARYHKQWSAEKEKEWQALIGGSKWQCPGGIGPGMYRNYAGRSVEWDQGKKSKDRLNVWRFDERGTHNAVCEFLRRLGVRWYMPGELGEIVPKAKTIAIPKLDEVDKPEFAMRRFNFHYLLPKDEVLWSMRLGLRDPYKCWLPHGMAPMSARKEMKEAHPEYYALYAGSRATDVNHLCLSNPNLVQENARFVRKMFDIYDLDVASVMPNDGFGGICQCPLCAGKTDLDRGYEGGMSDYVWEYVEKVAKEVAKTHPDKKILNAAYGTYRGAPKTIDKLSPNVMVSIVGGISPYAVDPETRKQLEKLRRDWMEKTDHDIVYFENYPHTHRGYYLPSFVPHTIAAGSKALRDEGHAGGQDVWLSLLSGVGLESPGFNHLNVYITARSWWDADMDVDAVLDEYCQNFYGPAADEMRAFIDYCEKNWKAAQFDKDVIDRVFELFATAQAKVDAESPYGKRIALLGEYLERLKKRRGELGKGRKNVPEFQFHDAAGEVVLDGKLDEPFWTECPDYACGTLKELVNGGEVKYDTSFKIAWKGSDLYVGVKCQDAKDDKAKSTASKDDDMGVWFGDCVEILIETDAHSYYQIVVSPEGAVVDLDRKAAKSGWFQWDSQAEAAAFVGDDFWSFEIRIPVTASGDDPLHLVVGSKPTSKRPWHFNICRQRLRKDGSEYSAFSPTGCGGFHQILKFGKLTPR